MVIGVVITMICLYVEHTKIKLLNFLYSFVKERGVHMVLIERCMLFKSPVCIEVLF